MNENKTNINWYPGHMVRTKKDIVRLMSMIDIVIEVIDSRVPYSSRIPELNKLTRNKTNIIVFNKYDLCDKNETNKWIKKYSSVGSICITCDAKNSNDYKKIIDEVKNIMSNINKKRQIKGLLPKKAKCMVIGVPNVGKSTIINKIVGRTIAGVGNKPGITKKLSTIKINEYMDLVDTPGILWPKFEDQQVALNLASTTIIKEEVVNIEDVAIHILRMLYKYYPIILRDEFGIPYYKDEEIEELFTQISKKKNIPVNGEVDYEKVSYNIVNSVKQEKIKGITWDRI